MRHDKKKVLDLLGYKCWFCGCTDKSLLRIHHRKRRYGYRQLSNMDIWYRARYCLHEIDNYQVACHYCHNALEGSYGMIDLE